MIDTDIKWAEPWGHLYSNIQRFHAAWIQRSQTINYIYNPKHYVKDDTVWYSRYSGSHTVLTAVCPSPTVAYLVRSDHDGMKLQHFVTEGLSIYALETGPTSTSLSLVPWNGCLLTTRWGKWISAWWQRHVVWWQNRVPEKSDVKHWRLSPRSKIEHLQIDWHVCKT